MLKCKGTRKQIIMPVFYDVGPGVVRHQTGVYEEVFEEHGNKYDRETLNQWREALYEVGALKGWELKNISNGHEGRLVKIIVSEVWRELKRNYSMIISDSLVGIDNHVVEMMRLLNLESEDVRIIGIHGMGGIGKSTIAKVIYNDLAKFFASYCFVTDVREISQRKGLLDLQNLLITSILKNRNLGVSTVAQGINVIRDTFCDKNVLIVLDDVDQREQLDALAQNRKWFGPGSRIIVTTRNMGVFYVDQTDGIYQPKELNSDQALQLFCKHAFRDNHPLEPYAELSTKIASTASGLPLALEIFGSFLCGKRKGVWEITWKKLKDIPDDKVSDKLRISYDALNTEQKQIFLDIACLYVGVDRTIVAYMWDACKLHPDFNIEVLIFVSLVKIGEDNKLDMHDQLKDLGRYIVRQEDVLEPEKYSRLWSHRKSLRALFEPQLSYRLTFSHWPEPKEVGALSINFKSHSSVSSILTNEHFEKLPNLWYLQLDCASLEGDFRGLLPKLRWLGWRKIPKSSALPTNLSLNELLVLDLKYNEFTHEWDGWNALKAAKNLKVLHLSSCSLLTETPDLSAYMNLEALLLRSCKSLMGVHQSIWHLKNLKRLDLSFTNLKGDIPTEIGNLRCLRTLDLSYTEIRSLPPTMHLLSQLEIFNLKFTDKLKSLTELPQCLVNLTLTCLNIRSTIFLKLVDLEELYIFKCPRLELQNELSGLKRLKKLKFKSCKKLKCVKELPPTLEKLKFNNCCQLKEITGLKRLKSLCYLRFCRCEELSNLDGLDELTSLGTLRLKKCHAIQRLPDLSNLKSLEVISVTDCPNLTVMHGLDQLQSLLTVELVKCEMVLNLSFLDKVSGLKRLQSYRCVSTGRFWHIMFLRILENVEGPCIISGELGPLSDSIGAFEYKLSFQRNSLLNFRNFDNDGSHYQLEYRNQDSTISYMLRRSDDDEGYNGDRELLYTCPESSSGFLLNYGSKHSHHSSFMDYVGMFAGFRDRFHSIISEEVVTFELRIKQETALARVISKENASGIRPTSVRMLDEGIRPTSVSVDKTQTETEQEYMGKRERLRHFVSTAKTRLRARARRISCKIDGKFQSLHL